MKTSAKTATAIQAIVTVALPEAKIQMKAVRGLPTFRAGLARRSGMTANHLSGTNARESRETAISIHRWQPTGSCKPRRK